MGYGLKNSVTIATAMTCMLASGAQAAMTISNAKTKNVTCSSGVCTPTGGNANLNVGELQTMLASSDVAVKSTAATPALGVLDVLTWTSTHRLTLDSYQSINVRAPIVVEGTSGLTLTTNDGGTGGDYIFESGGYANFWDLASSLVINGRSYALVSDIKTLASDVADKPSGKYALANSYDASVDGIYASVPIGKEVKGSIEGLGNSIANLSIKLARGNAGLFRSIGAHGSVQNFIIENISLASDKRPNEIGAIAAENEGQIRHVSASGQINGVGGAIGGVVGNNNGLISSSYSSATVSGTADKLNQGVYVGGLVGGNGGSIVDCHTSGDTSAFGGGVGGVAGVNFGTILNSSASGIAKAAPGPSGGLIGVMYNGQVSGSFATGTADAGPDTAGGLIGVAFEGAISNSFSLGSATGGQTGGLIGSDSGLNIAGVYSTGHVSGNESGGLLGFEGANASTSTAYWDIDTSGTHTAIGRGDGSGAGITGLTDAQLKSALPAGFDPNVWGQSAGINNGWPYLLANPPQ